MYNTRLIILQAVVIQALLLAITACKSDAPAGEQHDATDTDVPDYLATGQLIVSGTQAVLAKNLIDAIHEAGPEHALEFCNVQAIPLTDSMSVALNARIRRASDKPRNPTNRATETEEQYIRLFASQSAQGEQPEPVIVIQSDVVTGYYPILTNALCLQCHGKPGPDISAATLEKINALYPEDMATGYEVNMIRGTWVVKMDVR